uniref:BTB domain-containing protein n=1 Tax=Brassica campestris TaxID=3711 RepID=M4DYU3_BRACM
MDLRISWKNNGKLMCCSRQVTAIQMQQSPPTNLFWSLAARSKVFKKMLEEDECKTSSGKEIITLSEMKHEESNALDVYELAQIPFDDELNNAALSCIQMNITTIAYSDELKLFAKSNPNLTVEIVKACVERSRNNQYWVEYKNNQYWHKLRLV